MRMEAPYTLFSAIYNIWVYLHAYGGTRHIVFKRLEGQGLSPCVWRHLKACSSPQSYIGSISMRMEAPLTPFMATCFNWVYLHAYGGTKNRNTTDAENKGLSPCVWRHQDEAFEVIEYPGSISMRMEAPYPREVIHSNNWVYLHAYGGTAICLF